MQGILSRNDRCRSYSASPTASSAPPPRTEHHPSDSRPRRRLLQQPQRLDEETGTSDALTVSPRSLAEGRYQARDRCHGWGSDVLSAQHILRITSSLEP